MPNSNRFKVDIDIMSSPGGEEKPMRPSHPTGNGSNPGSDPEDLVERYVREVENRMGFVRDAIMFGKKRTPNGEISSEVFDEEADVSAIRERMEDLSSICRDASRSKPRGEEAE